MLERLKRWFNATSERKPPNRRSCSVYFRQEGCFIFAGGIMRESWLGVVLPMTARLPAQPSPAELGDAILGALGAFRNDLPEGFKPTEAPRSAGFRSWSALEKGARQLTVEDDGTRITLNVWLPHAGGGSVAGPGPNPSTEARDAESIGKLVLTIAAQMVDPPPPKSRRAESDARRRD